MQTSQIKEYFKKLLTEEERSTAFSLIKEIDEILQEMTCNYIIYAGTLLGYCRHKDLIPWDDDIDFLILGNLDFEKFQKIAEKKDINMHLYCKKYYRVFFNSSSQYTDFNWRFPFIDLFTAQQENNNWQYFNLVSRKIESLNHDLVCPVSRDTLGEVKVNVPVNAKEICRQKYGNDCLESATPPVWNHKKEVLLHDSKNRFTLEELKLLQLL